MTKNWISEGTNSIVVSSFNIHVLFIGLPAHYPFLRETSLRPPGAKSPGFWWKCAPPLPHDEQWAPSLGATRSTFPWRGWNCHQGALVLFWLLLDPGAINLGAVVGVCVGHTAWRTLRAPLEIDENSEKRPQGPWRVSTFIWCGALRCRRWPGCTGSRSWGRVVHEVAGCTPGSRWHKLDDRSGASNPEIPWFSKGTDYVCLSPCQT